MEFNSTRNSSGIPDTRGCQPDYVFVSNVIVVPAVPIPPDTSDSSIEKGRMVASSLGSGTRDLHYQTGRAFRRGGNHSTKL